MTQNFKSEIVFSVKHKKDPIRVIHCNNELSAQIKFDFETLHANEHDGAIQVDLVVHHPDLGKLIRRTMFLKN